MAENSSPKKILAASASHGLLDLLCGQDNSYSRTEEADCATGTSNQESPVKCAPRFVMTIQSFHFYILWILLMEKRKVYGNHTFRGVRVGSGI
jgi:hypothetical protein